MNIAMSQCQTSKCWCCTSTRKISHFRRVGQQITRANLPFLLVADTSFWSWCLINDASTGMPVTHVFYSLLMFSVCKPCTAEVVYGIVLCWELHEVSCFKVCSTLKGAKCECGGWSRWSTVHPLPHSPEKRLNSICMCVHGIQEIH